MRWPSRVACVACGSVKVSGIVRKSKTKNKRARLHRCLEKECKHQFSPTVGTVLHRSHLPLQKWFVAIALICERRKAYQPTRCQSVHSGAPAFGELALGNPCPFVQRVHDETCCISGVRSNNSTLRRLDCALRRSFPKKVHHFSVHFVHVSRLYDGGSPSPLIVALPCGIAAKNDEVILGCRTTAFDRATRERGIRFSPRTGGRPSAR